MMEVSRDEGSMYTIYTSLCSGECEAQGMKVVRVYNYAYRGTCIMVQTCALTIIPCNLDLYISTIMHK